jgi:hypothetical protein
MIILAAGADLSGPLLVVGAIAVAFALGRILARRGGSSAVDGGVQHMRVDEQIERIEEAGGRVLQEIEALGRETVSRAETRLRVLNELLVRAERAGLTSGDDGAGLASRFDEIYRLADEGVDSAGIAEQTEFERGEVDLILSLRAKSRKERGAS